MNIRLLATNRVSTVSANQSLDADLPLTNLYDPRREYVGRVNGTAVAYTLNFGASYSCNSVWVIGHNQGSSGAIISIIGSSNSGAITTSGTTHNYQIETPQSVSSVEVQIAGTNPIDVGYFMAGLAWSPTYNASYGLQLTEVDTTQQLRTAAGSSVVIPGAIYKRLTIQLDWLSESDRSGLLTELRAAGKSGLIAVSCYPAEGDALEFDHAFVARIADNWTTLPTHAGNWRGTVVLEEI